MKKLYNCCEHRKQKLLFFTTRKGLYRFALMTKRSVFHAFVEPHLCPNRK